MQIKLKFSSLKFSVDIKEVIKNLFDFSIGTAITETFSIDSNNEHKAFLLLLKTIKKTNVELAKEYGQEQLNKNKGLTILTSSLESDIAEFLEKEVIITKEFFEDIIQFNPNYLRQSFVFFKQYLDLLEIEYPDDINFIYFNNFRKNLEEEFQENKDLYRSLVDFFNNPIFNENKKILKQLEYYKNLIKDFVEPLQADIPECKETLKDLYIEPFFEIHKNSISKKINEHISEFSELNREISIHYFLKNYFFKNKKHPDFNESHNLLFVLGQPGQGKTAFCTKLVYDYIQESEGLPEIPIFFIKIRDLVARDFIDSTFNEIKRHIKQEFNFADDKCLLVLDGLDEAYMSGGLNDGDLRNLYERLKVATKSNKELKIILTSRFNYLKLNDSCIDKTSVIQLSILNILQVKEYSEKFKIFYPENKLVKKIDNIIKDENYEHILELLQQAVLLYFIAISDIDVEEKDSRTVIYDKIFTSLAKRSWDKNGQLSYIKKDLKQNPDRYEKLLREYIRNIAFAIYQSPNLYITINQLLQLEATTKFIRKCFDDSLEFSQEKIKEISKYLLISFYFQESKNNNTSDTAIEFFHNSLWEYLTAEYMWEENKRTLLSKDLDGDYNIVTKEDYFFLLNNLIGQKEISYVTKDNLINIISNEPLENREIISEQLRPLFYKLTNDDMLLEYKKNENTLTSLEKSINIFKLIWVFFYESTTSKTIYIDKKVSTWLFEYSFFYSHESHIENISFVDSDSMLSIPFSAENIYKNITFNSAIDNSWFDACIFENCVFSGGFGISAFYDCVFENIVFEKCTIGETVFFKRNEFINCKFIDIRIDNKNWIKTLNINNNLDSIILKQHKVEKIVSNSTYNGEKVTNHYIRYIGEE